MDSKARLKYLNNTPIEELKIQIGVQERMLMHNKQEIKHIKSENTGVQNFIDDIKRSINNRVANS